MAKLKINGFRLLNRVVREWQGQCCQGLPNRFVLSRNSQRMLKSTLDNHLVLRTPNVFVIQIDNNRRQWGGYRYLIAVRMRWR